MRAAKRARTASSPRSSSPTSSTEGPSSPPSSDRPHQQSDPPTSSITALGQRLIVRPSLASSQTVRVSLERSAAEDSVTHGSSAPLPIQAREHDECAADVADDKDDIMDAQDSARQKDAGLGSEDSAPGVLPGVWIPAYSVKQTPPVVPDEAPYSSSPFAAFTQFPSATQRRTKDEIAAQREAAVQRRKEREAARKRADRDKMREQLAKNFLGQFGFTVSPGTRYGTGKGGFDQEPVLSGLSETPQRWEPDARCSEEQLAVLEQIRRGGNVFFTGSAGVGKSFLLQEITRLLQYLERPYQVTATTGIAALQISGITIHSWAGVGLAKDTVSALYDKIVSSPEKEKMWRQTQALIVDEVSMCPADLFTKLNLLGKLVSRSNKPFGGLQLIVSGDYFQLPPVPEPKPEWRCMRCGHHIIRRLELHEACLPYEERAKGVAQAEIYRCVTGQNRKGEPNGCGFEWRNRRFAFETDAWAECDFQVMELTKIFRQDHPKFIATLEKIRRGICDSACTEFLDSCGSELVKGGSIKIQPTNLYPKKQDVNEENKREFAKLKDSAYSFSALDDSRGQYAATVMKERLANVPPAQNLQLKKGAQVLLLANLNVKGGLVNGSRGVIVDWVDRDLVSVDESGGAGAQRNGGPGSRARGGAFGGEEWREKAADEWADQQVDDVFPLVYFACGVQLPIRPHTWCIDLDKYNTVARTQLPLQLAWALTIHKSQGQSLDAVGVRLTNTFEKGQAYVALSRCRKPEGMRIEGFHPSVVMADPTVTIFYDCIKEKRPFFITPTGPINPLSHLHDCDLLIRRDRNTFGAPPRPLPPGSAVLAPGQKVAQPAGPAPSASASASALPRDESRETRSPPTWQDLLSQAVKAFLASADATVQRHPNGTPFDPATAFTGAAFKAATTAIALANGVNGQHSLPSSSQKWVPEASGASTSGCPTGTESDAPQIEANDIGLGQRRYFDHVSAMGEADSEDARKGKSKRKRKRPKRAGR